jgi:hypothetical protein
MPRIDDEIAGGYVMPEPISMPSLATRNDASLVLIASSSLFLRLGPRQQTLVAFLRCIGTKKLNPGGIGPLP